MRYNKKSFLLAISAAATIFSAANSSATDISFGDQNRYWGDNSTWSSAEIWNTDTANGSWNGNQIDVIGDPNITGGAASFTGAGLLQRITFDFTSPYKDWRMLAPGNLFINVLDNADDTRWDFVVNTMGDAALNKTDKNGAIQTLASGNYSLYDVSTDTLTVDAKRGASDSEYTLTGADNSGYWAGYYLRNNHPIGIAPAVLAGLSSQGQVYYSGFPGTVTNNATWTGTSYYDFTSLGSGGLDLQGRDFIIGWEMTCANDVVYEQITNPVPEPATMLLLGTGLAGLAGAAKRRKK